MRPECKFIAPNVGARTIVNFQISGARGGGATGGSGRTVGGTLFLNPVSEGLSLLGAGVPLGHVRIVEAAAGQAASNWAIRTSLSLAEAAVRR